MSWEEQSGTRRKAVKDLIQQFVDFQVVFVTAAGQQGFISEVPQILSLELPIITVGGVSQYTGHQNPDDRNVGRALTVSAPLFVECASGDQISRRVGTSFSAGIVAGHVADLLSRYPELRSANSVPKAVRKEVIRRSYARVFGLQNRAIHMDPRDDAR